MRQLWVAPYEPLHIADGAAFSTFTTFQSIAPVPAVNVPTPLLAPGTEFELEADGEFSNTGTPTLGLGFLLGSTTLAVGTAITTTTGATSWPWWAKLVFRVRTAGTAGTALCMGRWMIGVSLTAFSTVQAMPATLAARTVTIDTTITQALAPGAVWGTSSVSNTIKVNRFSVRMVS
jgi:hypothetical protein